MNLQLQGQLMNAAKFYKEKNWTDFWFSTGVICALLGFQYEGPCKELWDAAHTVEGDREKAWAVILQLMLKEGLELLTDHLQSSDFGIRSTRNDPATVRCPYCLGFFPAEHVDRCAGVPGIDRDRDEG